jgi:uncharacterized membrane protein
MSDFEYASVVVSIVLALGIADILRFIADTFREPGGRKLFWVHLLWVLVLLQLHVEFWWRMWSFRNLITVGSGLGFVLLGPALLFTATRTLLPTNDSDADLEALYFRRKSLFFVFLALLNIWALAFSPWSADTSGENITLVLGGFALVMTLFAACIFSKNLLLHKGVVSLLVALEVLEMLYGS